MTKSISRNISIAYSLSHLMPGGGVIFLCTRIEGGHSAVRGYGGWGHIYVRPIFQIPPPPRYIINDRSLKDYDICEFLEFKS
jgi:hypothetical protein